MLKTACPALAAAIILAVSLLPGRVQAGGNAQWCAVINQGFGDVYWDCQYNSQAQCAPVVVAGNRGFCNINPTWTPPAARTKRHRNS